MVMVRNFEIMSDKFMVTGMCTIGIYTQK